MRNRNQDRFALPPVELPELPPFTNYDIQNNKLKRTRIEKAVRFAHDTLGIDYDTIKMSSKVAIIIPVITIPGILISSYIISNLDSMPKGLAQATLIATDAELQSQEFELVVNLTKFFTPKLKTATSEEISQNPKLQFLSDPKNTEFAQKLLDTPPSILVSLCTVIANNKLLTSVALIGGAIANAWFISKKVRTVIDKEQKINTLINADTEKKYTEGAVYGLLNQIAKISGGKEIPAEVAVNLIEVSGMDRFDAANFAKTSSLPALEARKTKADFILEQRELATAENGRQ